ncbi:MAG: hypothetical protein ACXAE3_06985, partial [Candidatus Kariarchaeaceae archaeon]
LWTRDRKIEALSILLAAYLGYLIFIGFGITLIMVGLTWRWTLRDNKTKGLEALDDRDLKYLTLLGILGGVFGHPLYVIVSYLWLVSSEFYVLVPTGIRIQGLFYVFLLIVIFLMRSLLYISLTRVITKSDQDSEKLFTLFTQNNSTLAPIFPIGLLLLFSWNVNTIYLVLLPVYLVIAIIFGSRVLINLYWSISKTTS